MLRLGLQVQASRRITRPPVGNEVWRDVYRRAKSDARLRQRIARILLTVPTQLPRFWLAVLTSLGEWVDLGAPVPDYTTQSV